MLNYKKIKRAQVASTTTWIVATIIIVIILTIFYFASTTIIVEQSLTDEMGAAPLSAGFTKDHNLLITKTSIAYLLTNETDRGKVDDWLIAKGIWSRDIDNPNYYADDQYPIV